MLSLNGWINGITAIVVLTFNLFFGLWCIYQSKKTSAKLLSVMGLVMILVGAAFIGITFDFFAVIFTGFNLDNSSGIIGILGFMWLPIAVVCAVYLSSELLASKIKWYIFSAYLILAFIFELYIFLDPMDSIAFLYPQESGSELIEEPLAFGTPAYVLFSIFGISIIFFNGFGLLVKGFYSKGILRKKIILLSIGFMLFVSVGMVDALSPLGLIVILIRLGLICGSLLWYLGLREEPEISEKTSLKKEVGIEEGLFRLIKRPDFITEEEVTISKEKKICLVCKGKLERFNIYICPLCDTFYCASCARSLINLDNTCWICDTPFDEKKPSKLLKEVDIKVDESISVENKKIK